MQPSVGVTIGNFATCSADEFRSAAIVGAVNVAELPARAYHLGMSTTRDQIVFACHPGQKETYSAAAAATGKTLSEWIRVQLDNASGFVLQPDDGHAVRPLREVQPTAEQQETLVLLLNGPASVNELAAARNVSPKTMHHNVKVMRRSGMVEADGLRASGGQRYRLADFAEKALRAAGVVPPSMSTRETPPRGASEPQL